jgi:hypothetical protein
VKHVHTRSNRSDGRLVVHGARRGIPPARVGTGGAPLAEVARDRNVLPAAMQAGAAWRSESASLGGPKCEGIPVGTAA